MFDGRTSLFWVSSTVAKPEKLLYVRHNVYITRGVGLISLGGAKWKVVGGPYGESAFGVGSKIYTHPSWAGPIVVRYVRAPTLLLPLVFAAYPTIAFIRGPVRRWRRLKGHRCVHCGYNLTGLSELRCPECWEPIRSVPRTE
jgi:hypothetical protein